MRLFPECPVKQLSRCCSNEFCGFVATHLYVISVGWVSFTIVFSLQRGQETNCFFLRSLGHVYVLCPLPALSDFRKMQHWHCHPQRSGFTPGLCPEECHLGAFGDDLNRSQVLMKQTAAFMGSMACRSNQDGHAALLLALEKETNQLAQNGGSIAVFEMEKDRWWALAVDITLGSKVCQGVWLREWQSLLFCCLSHIQSWNTLTYYDSDILPKPNIFASQKPGRQTPNRDMERPSMSPSPNELNAYDWRICLELCWWRSPTTGPCAAAPRIAAGSNFWPKR